MAARNTVVTKNASPFLLAPGKTSPKQIARKQVKPSGSRSPPTGPSHARKTSEYVPSRTLHQKSGSPRVTSPKSPFRDLGEMLEFLSRKTEAQSSPYRTDRPRKSASPKTTQTPGQRSPKAQSPRPSIQPKVRMKVVEGVVKSPKLYDNQIFRDVFDADGQHDKELYSSFTDSSLEVYQEHQGAGGVMLLSKAPGQGKPAMCVEKCQESDSARAPDITKIEEGRQSPDSGKPGFREELWQKLARLQEVRNNSESETACEEVRDSRK